MDSPEVKINGKNHTWTLPDEIELEGEPSHKIEFTCKECNQKQKPQKIEEIEINSGDIKEDNATEWRDRRVIDIIFKLNELIRAHNKDQ